MHCLIFALLQHTHTPVKGELAHSLDKRSPQPIHVSSPLVRKGKVTPWRIFWFPGPVSDVTGVYIRIIYSARSSFSFRLSADVNHRCLVTMATRMKWRKHANHCAFPSLSRLARGAAAFSRFPHRVSQPRDWIGIAIGGFGCMHEYRSPVLMQAGPPADTFFFV